MRWLGLDEGSGCVNSLWVDLETTENCEDEKQRHINAEGEDDIIN